MAMACEICTRTYNSEFFDSIDADSSVVEFQQGVYRHFWHGLKISHLLCYAIVNVCKFCIYRWQHKCPTQIFHSCIYPSSCAVLTNAFLYRFAIRSWASVARSLCYSWATCFPRLISAVADWMSVILAHMVWP